MLQCMKDLHSVRGGGMVSFTLKAAGRVCVGAGLYGSGLYKALQGLQL